VSRLDYIRQLFAPETEAQRRVHETTTAENDQISIHPEEGKLLQVLMKLAGVRCAVEIGALSGYSALWIADALLPGGHLYTFEKDPVRASHARENLQRADVTLVEGEALKMLPTIENKGPFDMVFIDADKLNYAHYLDWAEKNVRAGGLIVGDNTLLFDAVWRNDLPDRVRQTAREAMRKFNARLADPAKYVSILIPTAEGMTIAVKK